MNTHTQKYTTESILQPDNPDDERPHNILTSLPCSAILYLNDDFEGGDFIFTELDAKTVTVDVQLFFHKIAFQHVHYI